MDGHGALEILSERASLFRCFHVPSLSRRFNVQKLDDPYL